MPFFASFECNWDVCGLALASFSCCKSYVYLLWRSYSCGIANRQLAAARSALSMLTYQFKLYNLSPVEHPSNFVKCLVNKLLIKFRVNTFFSFWIWDTCGDFTLTLKQWSLNWGAFLFKRSKEFSTFRRSVSWATTGKFSASLGSQ